MTINMCMVLRRNLPSKLWLSIIILLLYFVNASSDSSSSLSSHAVTPKITEAIEHCQSARIRNPLNDEIPTGPSYCLGTIYQSLRNFTEAIKAYEVAFSKCRSGPASFRIGYKFISDSFFYYESS